MIPPCFYIHTFPGSLCPPLYQIRQSCRHQRCSPTVPHCGFNFSHKWPTFAFTGESGYTHAFAQRIAHSGPHAETGGVSDGGAITTLDTSCTFTNFPGPGIRTASFAAFGSWSGGALKERREPAEQRCAYACRCPEGVAAPMGCVIFFASVEIATCTPCAQGLSVCARRGVVSLPSARFTCC